MLLMVNAGIKLIKSIKCILFIVLDSFQGICPVNMFPHPVLYSKFFFTSVGSRICVGTQVALTKCKCKCKSLKFIT